MIDVEIAPQTRVATISLNNPKQLNSLDEQDFKDLSAALDQAAQAGARALLIRGEGKAFCAGRNIQGVDPKNDDAYRYLHNVVTPVLRAIAKFPAPTFAAVHGACLGVGLGIAAACDVVYVAQSAKLGSPFAKLGAILDSGGHHLFVHRWGSHRAMDLIITGDLISGEDAVRSGLFSRCLPDADLANFTREKAEQAAAAPLDALLRSRAIVSELLNTPLGWWDSIEAENIHQGELSATDNYIEGITAFQEKRAPIFQHPSNPTETRR